MENIYTGKTVDEAVENGLKDMSLTAEEVEIEVLEEGRKKLFGSIPAQVKITKKLTDGERTVAFLKGLFQLLNQEVNVSLTEEDERVVINLEGQTKVLIGRKGETIDSIQTLAGAVANTGKKTYRRVVVDCGNYREEREESLQQIAEKLAQKAVRFGKRVRMDPMNPYERRIIHAALAENPNVTTKSEGEEPNRFVVIVPNNLKPYEKRDRGYNGRNRNGGYSRDRKPYQNNRGRNKETHYPKRDLPEEGTPQTSGTSFNREEKSSGYQKGKFNGFFGTFLGNSRETEDSSKEE